MVRITWIDGVPDVEIDGDGVLISCRSNDEQGITRMSRHNFRAFIEIARRVADEADRSGADILPFERAG